MPVRRFLWIVLLLSMWLGAAAATAEASPQNYQGSRYRNLGGSDNGTRAYLAGTGHTNSTGTVLASVGIQQNFSSTAGFIQMGEIQVSSDFGDICGSGITAVFVEYYVSGSTTGHCPKHNGIAAFGNGGLFAVAVGTNGWEAYWNGSAYYNPPALGYSSGWTAALAESWADPTKSGPSYAMTWGPSGQVAWQYKTASVGYTTIDTSEVLANTGNNWSLGGTPSPFNINWAGF